MRERLPKLRRLAARGEHSDDVVGADRAGMDRGDEAQHVGVVLTYSLEVDPAARGGVQRAVVGGEVDPHSFESGRSADSGR